MKKVPSYPKITSKTNITVTQTQNININSPKAILQKKGFKNQTKKIKTSLIPTKSQSGANIVGSEFRKCIQPTRRNSKQVLKQQKYLVEHKSIKNSKSQRQLAILSEKLKKLQQKINKIKEKEKAQKNSSASHRSYSKNHESNSYVKRDATSSRKQTNSIKKYHIDRNVSHKMLKKSYSDKLVFDVLGREKKKSEAHHSRKQKDCEGIKKVEKQKHDQQILHQLVTQVPNSHPNLKQSVQKSMADEQIPMTPSNASEQQQQLYYISRAVKSLIRPALFSMREHLIQSLQTLQYLNSIKKPSMKQVEKKHLNLPHSKFRETIILDLDETLIHCNQSLHIPYDVKLSIKFPTGEKIDAGINVRPHAKQFLQELSKVCEIIVFTASHECYANVVLNHLDPKKQLISYRLFRDQCWQTEEGVYIKDLRVLKNRSLQNMILVDNAAYSYYFQLQNGVPIIPYYDDKHDRQLPKLLQYIKQTIASTVTSKSSLRSLNKKYFRLGEYIKFQDVGPLVEELYNTDTSQHDIL